MAATVLATLAISGPGAELFEHERFGEMGFNGRVYVMISQPLSVLAAAFVKAFIILTVLKPLRSCGAF